MDTQATFGTYQAKNIGTFVDGIMYTTAAACFKRWPQVTLATWKAYVSGGKCGTPILHKKAYYVEETKAEEYAKSRGWPVEDKE